MECGDIAGDQVLLPHRVDARRGEGGEQARVLTLLQGREGSLDQFLGVGIPCRGARPAHDDGDQPVVIALGRDNHIEA